MTLGVIGVRALITLESRDRLMSSQVHFQTIFVSCRKVTLTALQCGIFHMLASDVSFKCLGATAYLLTDGAGFVAFPDPA